MRWVCVVICAILSKISAKLESPVFQPFPLGTIQPDGWLKDQINIQANGQSKLIDIEWPDVTGSGWLGGPQEGWERFPYFMDGFVPLAVYSGNSQLLKRVQDHINYIIDHQDANGWLGPINPKGNMGKGFYPSYDPWPPFVILKALMQQAQAFPQQEEKTIQTMRKFLDKLNSRMDEIPISVYVWADLRVPELTEKTGEQWQLDLSNKTQNQSFDWINQFETMSCNRDTSNKCHGVNNAQGLKQGSLKFREDPKDKQKNSHKLAIDKWDSLHGLPNGMFSSDEFFSGQNLIQGSETCTVVEQMFSLENILSVFGEIEIADKLEIVAYNALPSTFDETFMFHQQVQQANQAACKKTSKTPWTNVGGTGNLYGVAPSYGCCTANYHKGWPKFVTYLFMNDTLTGGIVISQYAPGKLTFKLKNANVQIRIKTDQPFGDGTVSIIITTDNEVSFPLKFRIPSWTENTKLLCNGKTIDSTLIPGTQKTINVNAKPETILEYRFVIKMKLWSKRFFNNSISIQRGPILLSFPIIQNLTERINCKIGECDDPKDFELSPTISWNYGLIVDEANLEKSISVSLYQVSPVPFSNQAPPIVAKAKGVKVPEWTLDEEYQGAFNIPMSPVHSSADTEDITLVPFGNTNLRISGFPFIVHAAPK